MSAPTGDPGGSVPTGDGAPKVPGEAYSFAVLRLVPRVERGERVNIGVVLHCRRHKFLGLELELDETRLRALDPSLDLVALRDQLGGLERIAVGDQSAGGIATLDQSDRFGFLTAPSSTIVQPSPVHCGMTDDPVATLIRGVCRGRANEIDVRRTGSKKLMVCFEVRTPPDAAALVRDISARPELASFQIDFCVLVK